MRGNGMDSRQKMDVVDWQDSPLPVIPQNDASRGFLSPTLIGIVGTLLLHAMLIQSLPFGSPGRKARPPEAQETAPFLVKSKADTAESLVLITLSAMSAPKPAAGQNLVSLFSDLSKMKIKSPVKIDPPEFLNIETLALSEEQASKAATDTSDGAEQSRLFGIYTGQIQARIDRVWRRPRTPVNEGTASTAAADAGDSFQCEVQIVQDDRGNVQEILLPRCNGSAAWQRSLVLAIRQASPLPAPPSASVFSQSITLNFLGLRFIAGAPEDYYEPERRIYVGAQ
jgi:TonB C terminal